MLTSIFLYQTDVQEIPTALTGLGMTGIFDGHAEANNVSMLAKR